MTKLNLNTVEGLDKSLDSLERRGKAWKVEMANTLSHIVKAYKSSGDSDTFLRLANRALEVATYANEAVANWFVTFSGVTFDKDEGCFTLPFDKAEKKDLRDGIDMAAVFDDQNAYFKFSPPKNNKDIRVFDIRAEMMGLIARAEKRLEEKQKGTKKATAEDNISADHIKALREAAASL